MIRKNHTLFLVIIVCILSSCHSGGLLKRRYQKGFYISHKKQDNTLTASTNNKQLFSKPNSPIEIIGPKNNFSVNNNLKSFHKKIVIGDSIIVTKKKGTKTITERFKTDKEYDVRVVIDDDEKSADSKELTLQEQYVKKYLKNSFISVSMCFIPIMGMIFLLNTWHERKVLKTFNENEVREKNITRLVLATIVAIIISLFFIVIAAAIGLT